MADDNHWSKGGVTAHVHEDRALEIFSHPGVALGEQLANELTDWLVGHYRIGVVAPAVVGQIAPVEAVVTTPPQPLPWPEIGPENHAGPVATAPLAEVTEVVVYDNTQIPEPTIADAIAEAEDAGTARLVHENGNTASATGANVPVKRRPGRPRKNTTATEPGV